MYSPNFSEKKFSLHLIYASTARPVLRPIFQWRLYFLNVNHNFILSYLSPDLIIIVFSAITQAFLNSEIRPRTAITSCEHCPLVWFHKLCVEIEQLSDRKTQAAILRR